MSFSQLYKKLFYIFVPSVLAKEQARRKPAKKPTRADREAKPSVSSQIPTLPVSRNQIMAALALVLVVAGALFAATYFTRGASQQRDLTPEEKQFSEQLDRSNNPEQSASDNPFEPADVNPNQVQSNYKVKEGDSLSQIAANYTGDGNRWTELAQANNILNPNQIVPSQELKIPANFIKVQEPTTAQAPSPTQAPAELTPAPATGGAEPRTSTEHTVTKGETLWSIAERYYGNGFDWYIIRDANSGKIQTLSSGKPGIEIGIKLTIPLSATTNLK